MKFSSAFKSKVEAGFHYTPPTSGSVDNDDYDEDDDYDDGDDNDGDDSDGDDNNGGGDDDDVYFKKIATRKK
jgi:hypothetical protein